MKILILANCTVQDITSAPGFEALTAKYARESSLDGMPVPVPDLGTYQALEDQGTLTVCAAMDGEDLVGFMAAQIVFAPQYGATLGMTLAYFVDPEFRPYGTGARLADAMCTVLDAKGAVGLMIGAPSESRLAKAAGLMGFKETNRLYFRGFK